MGLLSILLLTSSHRLQVINYLWYWVVCGSEDRVFLIKLRWTFYAVMSLTCSCFLPILFFDSGLRRVIMIGLWILKPRVFICSRYAIVSFLHRLSFQRRRFAEQLKCREVSATVSTPDCCHGREATAFGVAEVVLPVGILVGGWRKELLGCVDV